MVLKKLWPLAALASFSWLMANGQQTAPTRLSGMQRRLLRQITQYDRMESKYIGEGGMLSAQYARFDLLRQHSNRADLLTFTKYNSPVVRAYTFSTLIEERDGQAAFSTLQASTQDTAIFYHQFGCIAAASTVRLFMLVNLRSSAARGLLSLTTTQRQQLEDLYEKLQLDNDEEKIVNRQTKEK